MPRKRLAHQSRQVAQEADRAFVVASPAAAMNINKRAIALAASCLTSLLSLPSSSSAGIMISDPESSTAKTSIALVDAVGSAQLGKLSVADAFVINRYPQAPLPFEPCVISAPQLSASTQSSWGRELAITLTPDSKTNPDSHPSFLSEPINSDLGFDSPLQVDAAATATRELWTADGRVIVGSLR